MELKAAELSQKRLLGALEIARCFLKVRFCWVNTARGLVLEASLLGDCLVRVVVEILLLLDRNSRQDLRMCALWIMCRHRYRSGGILDVLSVI